MTNIDDILGEDIKPVAGGLRRFKKLKDSAEVDNGGEQLSPWGDSWKHRGGFPFRIQSGKATSVIFLTDVRPLIVHEIAFGERTGPNGRYPLKDYARSMTLVDIDENDNFIRNNTKECLFEKALGRKPKFIFVAKILDGTRWKDKEGNEHSWTPRHIIINNASVLQQFTAVSEVHGKDMQYARFKVMRSMSSKSPNIGDSWTLAGYLEQDQLSRLDLSGADRIDLDKGFPIYSEDEARSILAQHKRVVDKFDGDSRGFLSYDPEGMAAVLGETIQVKKAEDTHSLDLDDVEPDAKIYDSSLDDSDPFEDLDLPV